MPALKPSTLNLITTPSHIYLHSHSLPTQQQQQQHSPFQLLSQTLISSRPPRTLNQRRLAHTQPDNNTPRKPEPSPPPLPPNPSYPIFSFEGLGMSSRTKKIVYVLLGIYGTFESMFYARLLWQKFKPPVDESVDESVDEGVEGG